MQATVVQEDIFYVMPDLVMAVDTSRSTRQYSGLVEALSDKLADDFLNSGRHIAVVNFARTYATLGFTQDKKKVERAARVSRSDERYDASTSLPAQEIASLVKSRHDEDKPVCVAYIIDPSVPRDEFYGLLGSAKPDATLVFLLEKPVKKAPFWKRPFMKYPQKLAEAETPENADFRGYLTGTGAHAYPLRDKRDVDDLKFDDVSVPVTLPKNRWLTVG